MSERLSSRRPGDFNPVSSHVVAYRTDIGRSHHVNQDAGGAWTWVRKNGAPVSMIAVADGVSAGRKSEEASRLAIDILYARLEPLLVGSDNQLDGIGDALSAAARAANHEVARRPHETLSNADATTLVAACMVAGEGVGVWCGDSRLYHLTEHGAARLSRDHSWMEHVVHHGLMSSEDASRDPRAHMITRWLGPPHQDDPGVEIVRFAVAPNEVILCCTDGLYNYFAATMSEGAEEMSRVVMNPGTHLQSGLESLVGMALQRGGRDNITVAAVRAIAGGPNVSLT